MVKRSPAPGAPGAEAGPRPRPRGAGSAEIAIVGMAGRFPGAGGVEEFWGNLRSGVESITFFSDAELEAVRRRLGRDPVGSRDLEPISVVVAENHDVSHPELDRLAALEGPEVAERYRLKMGVRKPEPPEESGEQ